MTVIALSHLTLAMPYQVGTTSRSGNPWAGGSGWPLASQARMTPSSMASSMGSARSKWWCTPRSMPSSWPVKTTSTASSRSPASSRIGLSGVPVYSKTPIASWNHGT